MRLDCERNQRDMKDSYFDIDNGATVTLISIDHSLPDHWMVTSVEVQRAHRGKGAAGRLLATVLADADQEGATLVLDVSPDGTGLDQQALIDFYSRRGFIMAPDLGPTGMRRLPAGK